MYVAMVMQLVFLNKWSECKSNMFPVFQSFVMTLMSVVQSTTLIKIIKKVKDPGDKVESQYKETFCKINFCKYQNFTPSKALNFIMFLELIARM